MSFKDVPEPMIPLPNSFEDFKKPIIITKDYYNQLPENEKTHYEPLNKKEEK